MKRLILMLTVVFFGNMLVAQELSHEEQDEGLTAIKGLEGDSVIEGLSEFIPLEFTDEVEPTDNSPEELARAEQSFKEQLLEQSAKVAEHIKKTMPVILNELYAAGGRVLSHQLSSSSTTLAQKALAVVLQGTQGASQANALFHFAYFLANLVRRTSTLLSKVLSTDTKVTSRELYHRLELLKKYQLALPSSEVKALLALPAPQAIQETWQEYAQRNSAKVATFIAKHALQYKIVSAFYTNLINKRATLDLSEDESLRSLGRSSVTSIINTLFLPRPTFAETLTLETQLFILSILYEYARELALSFIPSLEKK